MFFWQASEEVKEERKAHLMGKDGIPRISWRFIRNVRIDNVVGMVFSEVATWSIIVVAATVLHTHGITTIQTSADAAKALEPLVHTFPNARYISKVIFAVGIIGLGLMSSPVLAGSAWDGSSCGRHDCHLLAPVISSSWKSRLSHGADRARFGGILLVFVARTSFLRDS